MKNLQTKGILNTILMILAIIVSFVGVISGGAVWIRVVALICGLVAASWGGMLLVAAAITMYGINEFMTRMQQLLEETVEDENEEE